MDPTKNNESLVVKPLLRGHLHQAAFFAAVGASTVLLAQSNSTTRPAILIYVLCLMTLFGISALYHRPNWSPRARLWMRRLDHSAIFLSIAGTATPVSLWAMPNAEGLELCLLFWTVAGFGVLQSLFFSHAKKWFSVLLYIATGSLAFPYLPSLSQGLGLSNLALILVGGGVYFVGALIYATKKPNPLPKYFGYHEIFHALVIIGAVLHFVVISRMA